MMPPSTTVLATIVALLALAACDRASVPIPNGNEAPIPAAAALACHFRAAHVGSLEPSYARIKAGEELELTFASLNKDAQTAQMIGNGGASDVTYWAAGSQLQFIEHTLSGNLTMTSVFAPPAQGHPLPAVHSRHIWVGPHSVVVSQYVGTCDARR